MSETFSSGNTAQRTNTERQLLVKILNVLNAGGGGGGGTVQVTSGHGAPSSTPTGAALYYDLDTGILYQWSGSAWN